MSAVLANNKQSPATIRFLGGLLIFIGLLLMGGIGAIIIWMNNVIANTGKAGSTQSYNGTPEQAQITFMILGSVAAFGFVAMITGSWQLFTGTRNKTLLYLMLSLWAVLMLLGWWVKYFL